MVNGRYTWVLTSQNIFFCQALLDILTQRYAQSGRHHNASLPELPGKKNEKKSPLHSDFEITTPCSCPTIFV